MGTTAEAETHQEAGKPRQHVPPPHQEAKTLQQVGTIAEKVEMPQEARTTAEAAGTQQVSPKMSLELRRKKKRNVRLEINRTSTHKIPQNLTRHRPRDLTYH